MTFSRLSLVFLAILVTSKTSEGCRRIDAAIGYKGTNYLFMGPDYVELDDDRGEVKIENKHDGWGGMPRIDAAVLWEGDGYPYFFEGGNYYYYSSWRWSTVGPYPNSDWNEKLELEKGVDAAVSMGGKSYFFKCCDYVVYDKEKEEYMDKASLKDLGIPCDLDAAMPLAEDEMALIKYDQVWVVCSNGTVSGPQDANVVFHLKSVEVCGEVEDEGESIAEDEEEEKE